MDALLRMAARALSLYDPLTALKHVALRDDADALVIRGIAMAQLGDYPTARKLLMRATKALPRHEELARARCLAALGEVALAHRDLTRAGEALRTALGVLEAHQDRTNAWFVRLQCIRHLLLLGAVDEAASMHDSLVLRRAPPRLRALSDLVGADLAMRKLEPRRARALLHRARKLARAADIAPLSAEIEQAAIALDTPVARVVETGVERLARLEEVEELLRKQTFVVDGCRRIVHAAGLRVSLVSRPVLLALAIALASAAPRDVSRDALAEAAFGTKRVTDSTRARLRVEMGRLRKLLARVADVSSTQRGYVLQSKPLARVVALLPPSTSEASALLALLQSGDAWSTSALSSALGASQRTIQRALMRLHEAGHVERIAHGRAQRWVTRAPRGFATPLLLVVRDPSE